MWLWPIGILVIPMAIFISISLYINSFQKVEALFVLTINVFLCISVYRNSKLGIQLEEKEKQMARLKGQSPKSLKTDFINELKQEKFEYIDPETGLLNNGACHFFLNRAAQLAKSLSKDFAIVYISPPREVPQSTIAELGLALKKTIRDTDLAFHIEEKEFLLGLEGCSKNGAEFFMKRLFNQWHKHIDINWGCSLLGPDNYELIYTLVEEAKEQMNSFRQEK